MHEIADGIYRINTPVTFPGGGGFSFNQYVIMDDEPLLFHAGLRKMFPLVREAMASILPVERLRYIAFSHVEADECGSLNEWLDAAPHSAPLCGSVAAMVSIGDLADRAPRALADGERAHAQCPEGRQLLEVDEHGFDEVDRRLLRTIIDKFAGGPVGLNTISAAISEEKDAIEDIYEPFLIQIGFLDRTPRGRVATARAYEYFGLQAPGRDTRL